LKRLGRVGRKRHESDIMILPSVGGVPLKNEPEAGWVLRQDGDMGESRLGIACITNRERGIEKIISRPLKEF
jgi:hypothetical protein